MQTGSADETSDAESSDSEAEEPLKLATDIRLSRHIPSTAISGTASPSNKSREGGKGKGTAQPSSTATLEQNIAFMEMSTMTGRGGSTILALTTGPSTSGAASASTSINAVGTGLQPTMEGSIRSPARSFRSPIARRRRRRSSAEAEDMMVASALLRASGDVVVDIADPVVEGLIRSSRRRRLGHSDPDDHDVRMMEVEPRTPS